MQKDDENSSGDGSAEIIDYLRGDDFYIGRVHPNGSSCSVSSLGKPGEQAGWGYACNMFNQYIMDGSVDITMLKNVYIARRGFGFFGATKEKTGLKYRE